MNSTCETGVPAPQIIADRIILQRLACYYLALAAAQGLAADQARSGFLAGCMGDIDEVIVLGGTGDEADKLSAEVRQQVAVSITDFFEGLVALVAKNIDVVTQGFKAEAVKNIDKQVESTDV